MFLIVPLLEVIYGMISHKNKEKKKICETVTLIMLWGVGGLQETKWI